jgi:hypothetical protein
MHLSANEIDVSFQYRYANQASVKQNTEMEQQSNPFVLVSKGHPSHCWWPDQYQTTCYPQISPGRRSCCIPHCCGSSTRSYQGSNSGLKQGYAEYK